MNDFVRCPLRDFDIRPVLTGKSQEESVLYDLVGVINHYGTLENGHYTSHCYNSELNRWFLYNDNLCEETEESDVITEFAYVLFYQQKGIAAGHTDFKKLQKRLKMTDPLKFAKTNKLILETNNSKPIQNDQP